LQVGLTPHPSSTSVCTGFSCFNLSAATIINPHQCGLKALFTSRFLNGSLRSFESPSTSVCTGLPCLLSSCHNSTLICGLKAYDATQADFWKAVFSLGTPPHPRLMHWPSLLPIKLPHFNPYLWSQGFQSLQADTRNAVFGRWNSSPSSSVYTGLPCFKEAATFQSSTCGLKATDLSSSSRFIVWSLRHYLQAESSFSERITCIITTALWTV
jgi:hypothetical protein